MLTVTFLLFGLLVATYAVYTALFSGILETKTKITSFDGVVAVVVDAAGPDVAASFPLRSNKAAGRPFCLSCSRAVVVVVVVCSAARQRRRRDGAAVSATSTYFPKLSTF